MAAAAPKRQRVAFAVAPQRSRLGAGRAAGWIQPEEEEAGEAAAVLPRLGPSAEGGEAAAPVRAATSSPAFEQFRNSLRASHAPLFAQYVALIKGERGLSGGADLDIKALGLGQLAEVVEALVQLADFHSKQSDLRAGGAAAPVSEEELVRAACELFELLCDAVAELPRAAPGLAAIPPEAYLEELHRRWSLKGSHGGAQSRAGECEATAARVAALFRMKDTVCSLYAWSLLSQAVGSKVLAELLVAEEGACLSQVRIVDPIAGTGFQGAVLRKLGVSVVLADSVDGGSTQSSGADTQYLTQCTNAAPALAVPPVVADPGGWGPSAVRAVLWQEAERLDVFDEGEAAEAWWRRHTEPAGSGPQQAPKQAGEPRRIPLLLLSFPPPPPSTVAEASLRRFRGDWLLFVGEWRGCTGTAAFFDALDADWELRRTEEVPRWPMMDDRAYLLRRRRGPAG